MNRSKFIFSVITHGCICYLYLALLYTAVPQRLDYWLLLSIVSFSAIYYILLWLGLYSQPYHHYLRNAFREVMRNLLLATGFTVLGYLCVSLAVHGHLVLNTLIWLVPLLAVYIALHWLLYQWIASLSRLGFFSKRVMLVGAYDERVPVERLFQNINGGKEFVGQMVNGGSGWQFRARLEDDFEPISKKLEDFLFAKHVNELIICVDDQLLPAAMAQCAAWCKEQSVGYYLIPDIRRLPATYPWGMRFRDIPQIERFCPNRDSLIMVSLKRIFDIMASACALVLLSPAFLIIAALIVKEDGFPVFYVSTRIGIHGRPIRFVKFRSMVKDAEKRKAELLALNERPDGPLFKITDDPRVTRIGAFLRKTSLDEIPQFWNVLKGDMSIIGPRPHLPNEVAAYSDMDNLRLECIPGIACLPQIRGRDTIGFREWVDLDLEYRKNWSILYDMRIMLGVARVVLRPLSHKA